MKKRMRNDKTRRSSRNKRPRPKSQIETGHWTEKIEPRKFSKWMQSVKNRKGKR
jgi:hypothetical protein